MPDEPTLPLLTVRDLCVEFDPAEGNRPAVDHISFELQAGEIVAVVGESGSGKTQTALSILRLVYPAAALRSGQIIWNEPGAVATDLLQLPETELQRIRGRRISMIFQEPASSLNPTLTCGEQVAEVLRRHEQCATAQARQRTLEWLAQVRLPDPERSYRAYPHQLSGGQLQRVMIAAALCTQPALLVADEPTTALDVTTQRSILQLIGELSDTLGTAVLFISHDLGVVHDIADRILLMQHGQIVDRGDRAYIFQHSTHAYTQGLLACRPSVAGNPSRLPTLGSPSTEPGSAVTLSAESPAEKMSGGADPLLSVQQLRVRYAHKTNWLGQPTAYVEAVNEVSFDLAAAETLGVVGESGCGKTTLGKAIARLVAVQGGSITYAGQPLLALQGAALRRIRPQIQMVFQHPATSLNPRLTVGEALREPLDVHRIGVPTERATRVRAMLDRMELPSTSTQRLPYQFSGGQQQRIAIARALMLAPRLLICDEAVSALDVSVQAQLLNLLKDLQASAGFAMLFISHDLGVIRFISDRVLVMQQGRVVETGAVAQICDQPQHPYTQQLLAAVPSLG